jgi:hypothetical protein
MDSELQTLKSAVKLIDDTRLEVVNSAPHRVWCFLLHASQHLQEQIDQIEAIELDPIFSDPESVSA